MTVKECTTCGANLCVQQSFAIFPCPNCGGEIIARCGHCRKLKNKYACSKCGFEGP